MRIHPLAALLCSLLMVASSAAAQCQNTWTGAYGCPGVAGGVSAAVRWDPDGAGPQPEQLVVGGAFRVAGDIACTSLAMWDPASGVWSTLPVPVPTTLPYVPYVTALAVLQNGQLAVAILQYGSPSNVARVAVWNGTSWSVLGLDFDDAIEVLHVRASGELLAGGCFAQVGGQSIGQLVAWNGASWQPFAGGAFGAVHALVERPTGELVVGGSVTVGGGSLLSPVVQWNGMAWSNVGAAPGEVLALALAGNGQLFAGTQGGLFTDTSFSWSQVPGLDATPYPTARVDELRALPNGSLVVGGMFVAAGGQPTNQIAVYDPVTAQWSTLGAGVSAGYALSGRVETIVPMANGDLVVGGSFSRAGTLDVQGIARHDGTAWHALSIGPAPRIECAVAIDDQQFVVAGRFRTFGDQVVNSVARWDGGAWQSLGQGLVDGIAAPADQGVADLVQLPGGDLLAAGSFGPGMGAIARWDGVAWSTFATVAHGANPGWVSRVLLLPNGDLVVGGAFTNVAGVAASNVASFDGVSWSALGSGPGFVIDMAVAVDGALLVTDGSSVRRWDGASWSVLGSISGSNAIRSIAPLRDGGVLVGGQESLFFGSSTRGWVESYGPSGFVHLETEISPGNITVQVHTLPDGDVLAMGGFFEFGGLPAPGSVRFDQPPFGPLDRSLDGWFVNDFATFPDGDLLVVGGLSGAGGGGNWLIARLTTTCPATSTAFGAGCSGGGGANVLTATGLPWIGATYASEATGMPANALAIEVLGLTTGSTPLMSVLPQGQPGCDLLVAPDLLLGYVTGPGAFSTALPIPDTAALIGAVFYEQVVALELDAQGNITALTSSNGLTVTIGAF